MEQTSTRDLSVSFVAANLYGALAPLPLILPMVGAFLALYGPKTSRLEPWMWFLVLVIGVFVHEFLHGLSWALAAHRPLSAVRFGFSLKALTPYAHIQEPTGIIPYRLGTLGPLFILGLLPGLMALLIGDIDLLLLGVLFTFGAGGDILVVWLTRRLPPDCVVRDHPERAGCLVIKGNG